MKALTIQMAELVDTVMEDARWAPIGLNALANRAANATLLALDLPAADYEIALLACDDARIKVLNGDFRDKPTATNVLSWPAEDLAAEDEGGPPNLPTHPGELGDIAIAYDTCLAEAQDQNKEFSNHLVHLMTHATLHLLGYDHICEKDATLMEGLEVQILAKLGIADPY